MSAPSSMCRPVSCLLNSPSVQEAPKTHCRCLNGTALSQAETFHGRKQRRSSPKSLQREESSGSATVCALSTGPGSKVPTKPSRYAAVFRQGATIVPRNLLFVTVDNCPNPPHLDRTYWAATDEKQALEAKKPYKDVRISGSVEGSFIFSTALSRHPVPFRLLDPVHVVLPLETRN